MRDFRFWAPVIVCLLLTPVCLLLGIGSAGVGHGDYVLARILFPYTMLSALLFDKITAPFVLLAIIQFPAYGLILGRAAGRGRFLVALTLILVVHSVLAAACFKEFGGSFWG
jgi:hypothetical protein